MLGFSESDSTKIESTLTDRVHPDHRLAVERAPHAHIRGETTRFESEHRLLHKDGGERWVLSRGAAIRHASGKAYRMIGLDSDITGYKRIEATLQHVAKGTANVTGREFFGC
jgi:PAS domain S-box-containing protein